MKFRKLILTNFKCYEGTRGVEFGSRLTIILGNNGDGKTTIIDALNWLFSNVSKKPSFDLVSKKAARNMLIGERKEVSVELFFEDNDEKSLKKSFTFTKLETGKIKLAEFINLEGTLYDGVQRINIEVPQDLLNKTFNSHIKTYCLFKGEDEILDVLNPSKDIVSSLLEARTDKGEYKKYIDICEEVANLSKKEIIRIGRKNIALDKQIKDLGIDPEEEEERLENLKNSRRIEQVQLDKAKEKIKEAEGNLYLNDDYLKFDKEIESIKSKIVDKEEQKLNFNDDLSLLDNLWILMAYGPLEEKIDQICAELSTKKQSILRNHQIERGRVEGREEFIANLPPYLLNEAYLNEMLDEKRCFVCGSQAQEGSLAYEYIKKLINYIKTQSELKKEKNHIIDSPFKHNFVEELIELKIKALGLNSGIAHEINNHIKDTYETRSAIDEAIKDLNTELESIKEQKTQWKEENNLLEDNFNTKNLAEIYSSSKNEKTRLETLIDKINKDIKERQVKLDEYYGLCNSKSLQDRQSSPYNLLYQTLDPIINSFKEAREKNILDYVSLLQQKVNYYLDILSPEDFHGKINITRSSSDTSDSIDITFTDLANDILYTPYQSNSSISDSQKVIACIAILFAFSETSGKTLTSEKFTYPLVFDAPASKLDLSKAKSFYETISNLDQQCIVMTKDMIKEDGTVDYDKLQDIHCLLYRLEKDSGLDREDQSTISTKIIDLNK